LVDVLQRISEHPDSRVAELTPRLWKQHFAANPLRSDIHDFLWSAKNQSRAGGREQIFVMQAAKD